MIDHSDGRRHSRSRERRERDRKSPTHPDFLKNAKVAVAAAMDGSAGMKRKLETLGDMPAVDMTMAEGEASVGDLEVDDDDDEDVNRIDQGLKNQMR